MSLVGAQGIINEGKNKSINKIPDSPSLYEIEKMIFTEVIISSRKYYQYEWKTNSRKKAAKPK